MTDLTDHDARFERAIAALDAANRQDPNREPTDRGPAPKELLYAQHMTRWLDRLYPEASDALRLAARCQHIERWRIPRSDYPMDRAGYLTWRRDLKVFHAERGGQILASIGYRY